VKIFNPSFGNESAFPYGSDLYVQPEYPEGLHTFTIFSLRTNLHIGFGTFYVVVMTVLTPASSK